MINPREHYCVFFDLDNTLINHSLGEERALRHVFELFELHSVALTFPEFLARYRRVNERLWDDYRRKKITTDELRIQRWRRVMEDQDTSHARSVDSHLISAEYLQFYDRNSIEIEGASEVVRSTRERYGFVGLISNGFEAQVRQKLRNMKWVDVFDTVIISESVGCTKPDPEIFRQAENGVTIHRTNMMYVGDNYEVDIVGAKNANWLAVWYNYMQAERYEVPMADHTIDSLSEFGRYIAGSIQ